MERVINKDVRALWQVCMRIKVSQGAHRSSWPGRWEAVCGHLCIWRWWECAGGGARAATNKGFARRPQELLAWEMGGRMKRFLYLEVVEVGK